MTLLLVLSAVLALVLLHWYVVQRRHRVAAAPHLAAAAPLYHPGHTWVRLHDDGLATVGSSALAANFVGALAEVELPKEGRRFRQAEPAWALISDKGRRLEQVMPLDGKVLAINEALVRDPVRTQVRPYDEGWICCIRPRHLSRGIRNLLPPAQAQRWLDATRTAFGRRLESVPGGSAYDGGEWAPGFGGRLDAAQWEQLRDELFPRCRVAADKVFQNT